MGDLRCSRREKPAYPPVRPIQADACVQPGVRNHQADSCSLAAHSSLTRTSRALHCLAAGQLAKPPRQPGHPLGPGRCPRDSWRLNWVTRRRANLVQTGGRANRTARRRAARPGQTVICSMPSSSKLPSMMASLPAARRVVGAQAVQVHRFDAAHAQQLGFQALHAARVMPSTP